MNVRLLQLVRISAPIAAALLVTANHGQAAGVTSFDVPSGGAVYEQVTLGKTEMKDLKGQTMYSYPLALKRTGGALPKIKVKVALPKGKTLKSVGALIVNIPPGGSAPILAQSTSASFGIGSSAIQAAPKKDWAYLSSLGLAVAEHVRKLNPKVKIIFAGFSAGGFAAELATYADVTRVSGLIQIGSFPMSGNDALPQSCPSVILVGQSDSNLDQATVAHQVQAARGAKIELLTHAGGHSWGSQADQALAIRALVRMRSGKAPEGLRISPELTSRLLALSAGDSVRELGPPVTSDYALVRKPGEAFDWRKALTTREIVRDFPSASLAIGTALDLEGFAVSTGSACSSGTLEPSHVLKAMGLDLHDTQNALRISLGRHTTDAEIDALIDALPPIVARLRALTDRRPRHATTSQE